MSQEEAKKKAMEIAKEDPEFARNPSTRNWAKRIPNSEWRLLVALARYGGLRIPSEIREMKWEDIHWNENRITINSPKTEHHPGGECRIIPLFPELLPHLQEQFELADVGSVYVFSDRMRLHKNHSTTLKKYIKRAGVKVWEKLFQNLRSTRQTELEEEFPSHVVCSWIGNSEKIARDHYLQITDEHFQKAACSGKEGALQNAVQSMTEIGEVEQNDKYTTKAEFQLFPDHSSDFCSVNEQKAPPVGLEPTT